MRLAAALTLPAAAIADHAHVPAPPLPPAVAALAPGLAPQGGGEMTFLGLSIYDGWYWGAGHGWSLDAPFALDLALPPQARRRAHRRAQRPGDRAARASARRAARALGRGDARASFPTSSRATGITGLLLPPGVVRYFVNGKPIGEIVDPAFARAFFGIWLDPKTSRADFRQKLLGEP